MGSETGAGLLYEGHRTKAASVLLSSCGMGQCGAGDVMEEGRRFSGRGMYVGVRTGKSPWEISVVKQFDLSVLGQTLKVC